MKFVLTQSILLEALQAVVGVVDNNKTIPLLSTILFSAEGNMLSLTGTDLEVQITSSIPFDNTSSEPFSFTLPSSMPCQLGRRVAMKMGRVPKEMPRAIPQSNGGTVWWGGPLEL